MNPIKEDVEQFLTNFKVKLTIWDVIYFDRSKNFQSLIDLEIKPNERDAVLKGLEILDYSHGPLQDSMLNGADMWVFGKIVNGSEIYIKITLGNSNSSVICISFHIAEHPMNYPFK